MNEKNGLVIFDMDGTLFDTEKVNAEAYRMALKPENIELTDDYYRQHCFGRHYTDFLPELTKRAEGGPASASERVHERKKVLYHECMGRARKNKILFDMIDAVREKKYIALVTTASETNVFEMLDCFGVRECFDLILSQENIPEDRQKPDPEGFLMAMRHFGAAPSDTVIFEDSDAGIEAAMKSGAAVMRVMKF